MPCGLADMALEFHCRSCGGLAGALVLDLGVQPLANNYLNPGDLFQTEPKFPLRLAVCHGCGLLQILDLVPPTQLFCQYAYFSSCSDTWVRHAESCASRYLGEFGLGPRSRVVEVASNDGYLLRHFVAAGVPCLGIEPAANIARVAEAAGVPTRVAFFGATLARELAVEGGLADLILGNNVFAHCPDPNDFVAGLQALLAPEGRVVLEFPHALEMLSQGEFDTIYHEHVFYFTLTAVEPLFRRHGLRITRVERTPLHGGSLRVFARHITHEADATVEALMAEEARVGVVSAPRLADFAARAASTRDQLRSRLAAIRAAGYHIAAYGAAAKGSTLLNYCGLGRETLDFVADRSPHKHGRLMPGSHVPIVPAVELARRRPDYTLLLAWNFAPEILEQQKDYRAAGGRFIIPVPEVAIV